MESKKNNRNNSLQFIIFSLVAAAFTNIYLTQPVLPILQREFAVDEFRASLSVAIVILGIALTNLPFGYLSDRISVKKLIKVSGLIIAGFGILCFFTKTFWFLILARFIQGLFIPGLTTCLVTYLARNFPIEKLNVIMGSYVAATVVGGLGGRLLGGWIHEPLPQVL